MRRAFWGIFTFLPQHSHASLFKFPIVPSHLMIYYVNFRMIIYAYSHRILCRKHQSVGANFISWFNELLSSHIEREYLNIFNSTKYRKKKCQQLNIHQFLTIVNSSSFSLSRINHSHCCKMCVKLRAFNHLNMRVE